MKLTKPKTILFAFLVLTGLASNAIAKTCTPMPPEFGGELCCELVGEAASLEYECTWEQ